MTQPYDPNHQQPTAWQPPQVPAYPQAGDSAGGYQPQPYPPPHYVAPPAKKKSSALPWTIGIVTVLIAALVGGAWFIWGRPAPADPPTYRPTSAVPSSVPSTTKPGGSLTELTVLKPTITGLTVGTQCFSFTMPDGYVVSAGNPAPCVVSVNIPKGDSLTGIVIGLERGAKDADEFTGSGSTHMPSGLTFVRSEILQRNGLKVGLIEMKDSSGLLMRAYFLPQRDAPKWSYQGRAITGYTIFGYAYNASLMKNLESVVDSVYQR